MPAVFPQHASGCDTSLNRTAARGEWDSMAHDRCHTDMKAEHLFPSHLCPSRYLPNKPLQTRVSCVRGGDSLTDAASTTLPVSCFLRLSSRINCLALINSGSSVRSAS